MPLKVVSTNKPSGPVNRTRSRSNGKCSATLVAILLILSNGFIASSNYHLLRAKELFVVPPPPPPDQLGKPDSTKTETIIGNNTNKGKGKDRHLRGDDSPPPPPHSSSSSRHDNNSNIESLLRDRYNNLPQPAPWPQLDHRTSKAIRNGHVIRGGDKIEGGGNTIVTAYYEFKSKHGVDQYEKWFSLLLAASDPMIIFVEPGSRWFDYARERRQHAPTIIAGISFGDLVMSTTPTEKFWNFMHSIDRKAKIHRGSGVYKIWNEKMIFMYASVHMNPFHTPGFVWMDAGYFRRPRSAPSFNTSIAKINITEAGIPHDKLLLLHVRNDTSDGENQAANTAGNSFAGTGQAFLNVYSRYYETFWDWAKKSKFIGSDQFVMTETCRRNEEICHPFFPGKFIDWFAMKRALAGKICIKTISPHYVFLDKNRTNEERVIVVPDGKRISYCYNQIVTMEQGNEVC